MFTMGLSINGILEKVLPGYDTASYKIQGSILRAVKAGLSATVGVLLAAALAGTLFPVGFAPAIVVLTTMGLQWVDKFIREWKVEDEAKKDALPLTDNPTGE